MSHCANLLLIKKNPKTRYLKMSWFEVRSPQVDTVAHHHGSRLALRLSPTLACQVVTFYFYMHAFVFRTS